MSEVASAAPVCIDFTSEAYEGVREVHYPNKAQGWVEGIYRARRAEVVKTSHAPAMGGLSLEGYRLVEESEPLAADALTICRSTYMCGTHVSVGVAARDWDVMAALLGGERAQRLRLVINDEELVEFSLGARERREVRVRASLTKRGCDLCVVPAACPEATEGAAYEEGAWAHVFLERLELAPVAREAAPEPRIFIAADSTAQTYFDEERPQAGWGEWLYWYLYRGQMASVSHDETSATCQARVYHGEGPTIYNRALGGRSTKSYFEEHRLARLLASVRPGDAVIVQFGLNEASKNRPMRYVAPEDYEAWLARYVACIEDRGATAIIVTPPPLYRAPGEPYERREFDDYADAARAYAAAKNLPLIDLFAEVEAYLDTMPEENREAILLRAPARQYVSHPDGVRDVVHLSTYGARVYAGIIARGLSRVLPWVELVAEEPCEAPLPPRNVSVTSGRGIVGLEANLEWDEPQGGADYYVVEKYNAATGRFYLRTTTIAHAYADMPLPGQGREVEYRVSAWRAGKGSQVVHVTTTLPADDSLLVTLD